MALDVPREFTLSPDGSAVAFTRESGYGLPGKPGIYVVDITTGYQEMPSDVDRAGTGGTGSAWAPLWSPDGAGLLLRAYAGGSNPGLVWAARDGSWSHAFALDDLDRAAAAALGQENACTNLSQSRERGTTQVRIRPANNPVVITPITPSVAAITRPVFVRGVTSP